MSGKSALVAEYNSALHKTRFDDLRPLIAAGVTGLAIGRSPPAAARIVVADDVFEFDEDAGAAAFVMPVRMECATIPEAADPVCTVANGEVVDLVGFHPLHPDRWALRRGTAEWLGAIEPQHMGPAAVRIWRSPMAWLRADCDGLVLLSNDRRDQCRTLSFCSTIIAEDAQHAIELRRILELPWSAPPVIVGSREAGRRAA